VKITASFGPNKHQAEMNGRGSFSGAGGICRDQTIRSGEEGIVRCRDGEVAGHVEGQLLRRQADATPTYPGGRAP
jgi:hypothetical protein